MDDSDDEIPELQILDESTAATEDDDKFPSRQTPSETAQHESHKWATNDNAQADLSPVPVTILTGFLGSGKTTLIRHILISPDHNRRIAVIENEFGGGDESDAQLVERLGLTVNDVSTLSVETMIAKDGTDGSNLADFIELSNGCVCCTVKDSLVATLESLLAKRTDLDYVIIEASGMADPGPVASIFWLDEALESRIRLDGIVTCVDAKNISFQLKSTSSSYTPAARNDHHSMLLESTSGGGDEAARQIAFADRIIVNKVDLLQSSQNHATSKNAKTTIETVFQEIREINPFAPIKTTMYSKINDLDWILDANCFDAARARDIESTFQQSSIDNDNALQSSMAVIPQDNLKVFWQCRNPSCTVDHALNDSFCGLCNEPPLSSFVHKHTNAVGTIALFGRGSVDLHKTNTWLASVLWPDQDESDKIVRARLEKDLNNDSSTKFNTKQPPRVKTQTIYRMKGVLSVGHATDNSHGSVVPRTNDWVDDGLAAGLVGSDGSDQRRFIVQAVNDLWDINPSQNLHWGANETRCCKIVVIGKWLDEGKLRKGFKDCFLNPKEVIIKK